MTDGKLAATGFEAASPAHGRSAVGGVTHLFHMLFRGNPGYYSILERSRPANRLCSHCGGPPSTPSRTSTPRTATPLLGRFTEGSRIYCATGFSGAGFKNAAGYGETAAHEALDKQTTWGLDLVRPERFSSRQPAS